MGLSSVKCNSLMSLGWLERPCLMSSSGRGQELGRASSNMFQVYWSEAIIRVTFPYRLVSLSYQEGSAQPEQL